MNRDHVLRNATMRILKRHGPIGTGSLVRKLQAEGQSDLRSLWKLLEQLRAEGVAVSNGPPARLVWDLVRDETTPQPPREASRTTKTVRPRRRNMTVPPSAPTQPAPTQPAPTQSAPTQSAPTQPAPTQPIPASASSIADYDIAPDELEDPADFLQLPPAPTIFDLEDPATFVDTPAPTPAQPGHGRGRPIGAPRTTPYKNLTRCDYPDHFMVGYMVRITWNHQHKQAFFADSAHGGRLGALAAALDWRDQTERDLGKSHSARPLNHAVSNTGVEGISRTLRSGRPILQVTWYEHGQMRRTSISITKHGEAEAMRMAKRIRERDDRTHILQNAGLERKSHLAH